MASVYPGSLDAFSTSHVTGDTIQAADVNDLADAANKIEAELGTNPSGSYSTVLARLNALPGTELAYVEFTSPVAISTTSAATATQLVSAGAVTYAATPTLIEFFSPYVAVGANAFIIFVLYDSSTELGRLGQWSEITSTGTVAGGGPVYLPFRITPSAASHTYIVKAYRLTANGTVHAGAFGSDTLPPGFIRITLA